MMGPGNQGEQRCDGTCDFMSPQDGVVKWKDQASDIERCVGSKIMESR